MWAALALLAIAAAQPELTGNYEAHQMELAGALRLDADGHFAYALDYGAVSEACEGRWSLDQGTVHLTAAGGNPADPERSLATFKNQPVAIDGDALLLRRYERLIRFERAEP